jgi:hypothetical protein
MVGWLVVAAVIAGAIVVTCARTLWRAWERRHQSATMFVTTYPGIELDQSYGGWDADAYDSRPDSAGVLVPLHFQPGMPSRWSRRI